LRRMAKLEGISPEINVEERPDLEDVQIYEFFLPEFRPLLLEFHNRFPKHQMLLNISSGSPAMKSALYLLAAFLPFPVWPVQTFTPVKAQNPRLEPHMEYDVDLYWECNLDNEDYTDRCHRSSSGNLDAQRKREEILAHLRSYDYAAALMVADSMRPLLSPRAYGLIEAAKVRGELNWRSIKPEWQTELGFSGCTQNRTDLVEYLLWLQAKQKREDLADFLRGLTPGLYELLRLAVEERAGYPVSHYCNSAGRFRRNLMTEDELGQELLQLLEIPGRNLNGTFLISGHYAAIIEARYALEPWAAPLLRLRRIEESVRNPVAHTITRVDEAWLQDNGEVSSEEIVDLLRDAVRLLSQNGGSPLTPRLSIDWGSYDLMNQKIEQALSEL
ncbi:MAG: hypothetical protein K2K53_03755, partial [Oscillospiraceae bacterium]|nr:hypothetical protein [Oscillospiraceae bacterium]